MYCYKKTTNNSDEVFVINGVSFSLQECDNTEAALVEKSLEELWYIRMYSYSEEKSGGWSGTKSNYSFYRDIKTENAVVDGGKVIGFRVCDENCDPEVALIFFDVEKAGEYYPIKREEHYSFDGGDGDGVTTYSFALEKKDKRIVDFINTYCFYEEENDLNNADRRVGVCKEICYDSVETDDKDRLFVRSGMDRFFEEDEGKKKIVGGPRRRTIEFKRK